MLGILLLVCVLALTTIAGIGGGGIIIPFCKCMIINLFLSLGTLFFKFDTKQAVAISGFTILFCSISRFVFYMNEKHPEKNAVVIDYNLAAIMLPIILMGSMLGVLVNIAIPSIYLNFFLFLALVILLVHSALKG